MVRVVFAEDNYLVREGTAALLSASGEVELVSMAATYEELMRIVWDESPWIFLYHQQDLYGVRDRVKNFRPTPEAIVRLEQTEVT